MLNYKKPAFWVTAVSLAACAIAAVCFLTDPVTPPDAPDNKTLYLNSVEPEVSHTYVGGALLYQSPFLSSYFPDGGSTYTSVSEAGDTLILSLDGSPLDPWTGNKLVKSVEYSRAEFLGVVPSEMVSIIPQDVQTIACRCYDIDHSLSVSDNPYTGYTICELRFQNGGTWLWLWDGLEAPLRVYALVDKTFNFWANGALWTYDPSASTIIPIRFDLEGPVTVAASALSRSVTGEWTRELTVESGETIYWRPSQDGEAPRKGTALDYSFHWDGGWGGDRDWKEKLTLRPVMDYQGLYGSQTYGISNNWLGVASSAICASALRVDTETGELVVSLYGSTPGEDGPYAIGSLEASGRIMIRGKSVPPEVTDVAPVQPPPSAIG